jgi:hypothetical protein
MARRDIGRMRLSALRLPRLFRGMANLLMGGGEHNSDAGARENDFVFGIVGLDPAIHAELHFSMDHRVKPGGDEMKAAR